MKKIYIFVIMAIMLSSCSVTYFGTSYGRIRKNCTMTNQTAYFYKRGTGKNFLPKYVFLKRNKL